jgi:hypothetical protein
MPADEAKQAPAANADARSIHRWVALALQLIMLIGLALSIHEQQWLNVAIALYGHLHMKRCMASPIERWTGRFIARNPRMFGRE